MSVASFKAGKKLARAAANTSPPVLAIVIPLDGPARGQLVCGSRRDAQRDVEQFCAWSRATGLTKRLRRIGIWLPK